MKIYDSKPDFLFLFLSVCDIFIISAAIISNNSSYCHANAFFKSGKTIFIKNFLVWLFLSRGSCERACNTPQIFLYLSSCRIHSSKSEISVTFSSYRRYIWRSCARRMKSSEVKRRKSSQVSKIIFVTFISQKSLFFLRKRK